MNVVHNGGNIFIDKENIYMDNGDVWSKGKVIAVSDYVKTKLENPHFGLSGDSRNSKIYNLKIIAKVLVDNIHYFENENHYFSIDFKTELVDGKYVLKGFNNYNEDIYYQNSKNDKASILNNTDKKEEINNEEIDEEAIYMDNGEIWHDGLIIASSDKVIKELEKPGYGYDSWDSRKDKIYTLYAFDQYVDDISYVDESGETRLSQDFQTELINGKNTLVGFNNFITDEMKKSRSLQPGTEIFDVYTGRSLSTLVSRLNNNIGWVVNQKNDSNLLLNPTSVYDSAYGKKWSDKLSEHIVESRNLKPGTSIHGKTGKAWSNIESRLDDNLGWKLSSGSKALDASYGTKWFTNN